MSEYPRLKLTVISQNILQTQEGEPSRSSSNNSNDLPVAIKNVNVFISLENCEKFIEKENHQARITKLRTEGLNHLQDTNWMYQNN